MAREARDWPGLVLVAGRYEGVDERFIEREIDEQWSIGDYVLSGGELPALVVIDAIARLMPGTLGQRGIGAAGVVQRRVGGLAALHAAAGSDGHEVPAVLASGDHAAIRRWRLQQALGRTWLRRPELLERRGMSDEERELLEEFKIERARAAGGCEEVKMRARAMNKIIQELNGERATRKLPDFNPGDTVVVQVKVVEGDRERVQAYEGVVIAKKNRGLNSSFTVRKISHGEGVERVFQTFSPVDQRSQRQAPRRCAPRQAVLPARSVRQGSAHRREDLSGSSRA